MTFKRWLWAFAAGFLSTLFFHQGLVGVLYVAGVFPRAPFNFEPTAPFGVPAVISTAFFGGLWAMALTPLIRRRGLKAAVIAGAIGPTALALGVVFPLKGLPFNPLAIPLGLVINGCWGLGVWLILRRSP